MLARGMKTLQALYDGSVHLGHVTREQATQRLKQLEATLDYNRLKDTDLASLWLPHVHNCVIFCCTSLKMFTVYICPSVCLSASNFMLIFIHLFYFLKS